MHFAVLFNPREVLTSLTEMDIKCGLPLMSLYERRIKVEYPAVLFQTKRIKCVTAHFNGGIINCTKRLKRKV